MTDRFHPFRQGARRLAIGLAVLLLPVPGWSSRPLEAQDESHAARDVRRQIASLPLTFVSNAGQTDASVRFQSHALGGSVFFTPSEVVLALPRATSASASPGLARDLAVRPRAGASATGGVALTVLRLRFVGADAQAELAGAGLLPGTANFFRGNDPARWRSHVPMYAAVEYRELYPGIDLRYEGVEGQIKGSYSVRPGADPSRIRWIYAGARSTHIDEAGNLLIALPPSPATGDAAQAGAARAGAGTFVMERSPVAWQEVGGRRLPVAARYTVAKDGSIGFALPAGYDRTQPLILDPTLTYSTFLGGGGFDVGYGIAVDAAGAAYVTGSTLSADFPTQGPIDPGCGTDGFCDGFAFNDAFVAKLNPSVSGAASLVFSTYLGGSADDTGVRIVVDGTGASYVTGLARANFPTTATAYQQTYGGSPGADAFFAKLSADGSQLLYSTYLGGSDGDGAWGITLDASNNAYITGQTFSANFPTTVGALDTSCGTDTFCNAASDAFVAEINPAASGAASLVFSTYLGGSDVDQGFGVTRDASNNLYITGRTLSTDFPTAGTPFQSSHGGGGYDAFVAKLSSTGTALSYSTYLGGDGYDDGYTIALGSSNRAYVTGTTSSSNLPTSATPFQSAFGGGVYDAYLTKVDPAAAGAASLVYSTYLGGNDDDEGYGLAVDAFDVAYLGGFALSTNFPTAGGPFQPLNGGFYDGFVMKVDPAQTGSAGVVYSTFLGGLGTDAAFGVALDSSRNIYVTGQTYSSNSFPTVGAFQSTHGGSSDVFVAKIDNATTSADLHVVQTDSPDPVQVGSNVTYTITVTNSGPATATGVRLNDSVFGSVSFVSATPTQGTCSNVDLGSEQDVGCNLGTMGNGATVTVSIVVTATFGGSIVSTATVSSNVSDPDGSDNGASETTNALDLIFADGFETGDTSRWSTVANDGNLTVTADAAMGASSMGMQTLINDTNSLYVEDSTPLDEPSYRARFYIDPNGFDTGVAQSHFRTRVFLALEDTPTRRLVAIVLKFQNGQYSIMGRVRQDDDTVVDTGFINITNDAHSIEFDWERSSGPGSNDGLFQMWIDSTSVSTLTGLDTDLHSVDTARMGGLSLKTGASGTIYFDQFESRRHTFIGP
jgi:uncharacterized repeat protein (TIGR01451 family)